nr:MAG TPA: hypothetical protein [Caudoviricetes sp.]
MVLGNLYLTISRRVSGLYFIAYFLNSLNKFIITSIYFFLLVSEFKGGVSFYLLLPD